MKLKFDSSSTKLFLTIGTVAVLGGVALLVRENTRPKAEVNLMSVHDRVVVVVTSWANASSRPDDTMQLQVVWATSGHDVPFYPEAAQLLEQQMKTEFRESKTTVMHYRDLKDAAQNPGGSVSTVSDLARLVRANYEPQ